MGFYGNSFLLSEAVIIFKRTAFPLISPQMRALSILQFLEK